MATTTTDKKREEREAAARAAGFCCSEHKFNTDDGRHPEWLCRCPHCRGEHGAA